MATSKPGGYGQEHYGDPMGSGGPLHIVRARAVRGQVVRVVYDEEPLHRSAVGSNDALNPANYSFEAVNGVLYGSAAGATPTLLALGVDEGVVRGPTLGVQAGDECALDVHVDKPLVVGMVYRVTVRNVKSRFGGILGAPYSATFSGIVAMAAMAVPRQPPALDWANNPALGNWTIDSGGDISTDAGLNNLRKRIFRRMTTPRGAFSWMPDYGAGRGLKEVASLGQLQGLRSEIVEQVKREPEVESVTVNLTLQAIGVLQISTRVQTKQGETVSLDLSRQPDGPAVVI